MKYTIKRNHKSIAVVAPKGEITEKLFGEETLTMDFSLTKFVKFQIGDYVEVYGKTYYISVEPTIEKISTREYKYQLVFNGIKYRLAEVQYFFYDEKNQLTMPEFSIMGNARKMVELLVANANRVQSGWSVGTIDDTEHKLVDFSNYNCLGALTRISDEFGLEFWIDEDKSIHLTERKRASGYTFTYGQSNGLKNITRSPYTEASLVTRLYAKGAEKNIPKGYRNGQKALRMGVPYLEKNITQYGVVEHTQTFEDIYPKRVGTVTEVYDNNPLQFTDNTLDFDLNSYNEYGSTILIAGVSAKVIFQTGDLAGYTLEVKQYGYNSATKTFTLLKNKDEKTIDIPSEHFRPRVGDKYILVDIMMPQTYVEEAERELQAKAQEYLDKNSRQRFIYTVTPDPLYMKQIRANIVLGQTVRFTDADFQLDDEIRIVSVTRDIQNPYKISFEIAEQATIVQIVRNYIEKEKKQTALVKTQKQNAEMARRSWLFAKEVQDNIFDNEGYFDSEKIKPLSIETGMLSVGSRMQQFSLPNISLTISDDNLRLKNTAGQMVHLNIDPKFPRTWNIAENETPNFSRNFNYIYLKADKVGNNAVFVVSEQKIMLDSDPVFYYFLVGSVSSIVDNVRRIKTNYGFTQVSPNEITTGRISSGNGEQWIDLLQDRIEIKAKVHFTPDSPALQQTVNSVKGQLGSLAFKDAVEKAQLGTTLLQGGYIKSELINAPAIVSNGGGITKPQLNADLRDIREKTDNFTAIQGGLISSNVVEVGNDGQNRNAFISGVTDAGGLSVRFGAGTNYSNKNNAPFRVLDNGKVIASDAEITGEINARRGRIGGFDIANETLRAGEAWKPNSYFSNYSTQMFIMRENGATTEQVREFSYGQTSALSTGRRGVTAVIKNTLNEDFSFRPKSLSPNIALQLEAKNGSEDIALDIKSGGVRMEGKNGATGIFGFTQRVGGTWTSREVTTTIEVTNGIITNITRK